MNEAEKRQSWADFWSAGQGHGGCLAGAGSELGAAQERLWRGFAAALPRRARVLDLGTGDGIVLAQLARTRPDLKLTGVDSAPTLPAMGSGKLRLMPATDITSLPFAAASSDSVVSQFGYEYAATERVAGEVARVLAPGGRFQFLVHHRDGPIVAHNARRAAALRWAILDSGLLDRARALANARRNVPLPTPPHFAEAAGEAARRFPGQSVAAEIAEAVRQCLALAPSDSLAALAMVERKANGELIRLDALAAAARDSAGAEALAEELRAAGLAADPPRAVANRSGEPFCWLLSGSA